MDSVLVDISEGIRLFNDGEYFASHDFFEDIWMQTNDESRLFYQGLIQISVGCYHLICGNYRGAYSQFNKGSEKLNKYSPSYYGVDIKKLLLEVSVLQKMLEGNLHFNKINFDIKLLPKIQ